MAVINGTSANNTLWGTSSADTLQGYGGDDKLYGQGGDDIIYGGSGRDQLLGEAGNDVFLSGSDATPDWVTGELGSDSFYFNVRGTTGLGSDTILDYRRSDSDRIQIEGDSFKATLSYYDKNSDGTAESTLIKLAATGTNQSLGTISVENARLSTSDLFLTGGTATIASTTSPSSPTSPAPTTPSTTPLNTITVGSGSDTLKVKVAEDAYQGDAQFTVWVDGKQIGGTLTAKALKSLGQHDLVQVKGDWGVGNHTVGVKFVNDLSAGTASQDRNLYVEGVTYNNAVVSSTSTAMTGNGTKSFTVTDNTAIPTAPTVPTSPAPTPAPTPDTNTRHLYVSTTGSDANAGTASSPFKTIQKAAISATAGTTVHVAPGVYNETIRTSKSGTADAPINYVSDVKGGAIIKPSGATGSIWSDSGSYVAIKGFEIDGTNSPYSRSGVMINGAHSKVVNNEVHHILMAGSTDSNGGAGILLNGGYYGNWDQHAIGNTVHDVGNNSPRVHGIYHQGTGSIVNNIVYSTSQTGIVGWHDPHDILVANNTVFHNRNGISFGAGDTYHANSVANNIRVINNIAYDNSGVGIDEAGITGTNNVYVNNLVYKNGINWGLQNGMQHQGTITADPQFMNYVSTGGGNYHLNSSSPAINRGTTSYSAPTTDIDGYVRSNPDIGAHEWFTI